MPQPIVTTQTRTQVLLADLEHVHLWFKHRFWTSMSILISIAILRSCT